LRSAKTAVGSSCGSHLAPAGWDEFYESELARFHEEMFGEEVFVVPDDLLELVSRARSAARPLS